MLDMPSRYLPKPIHTRSSIYLLFTIDLAKSYPGRKKLIDNPKHTVYRSQNMITCLQIITSKEHDITTESMDSVSAIHFC